jgi:hypothetical protein
MLKSGDFFLAGKTGGVMGAVVPWGKGFAGVAPGHIFHYAGTDRLSIGGQKAKVVYMPGDADLAFFPLLAAVKPTELAKPKLGGAVLENAARKMTCRISDTSWSICYVVLPPGDLPGHGDSGTPLVQEGKVVGMLLSLNMHTCKGIAISAEMIKSVAERKNQCK